MEINLKQEKYQKSELSMSAVDFQGDPQKNQLLKQSLFYQIYCNEGEYHLDRNLIVSLEKRSQWKIFERFCDLGWESLGGYCQGRGLIGFG